MLTHSHTLSIIETETPKVVETVKLANGKPNRTANLVTAIDLSDHSVINKIPVGKAPHGMAYLP